MWRGKRDTGTTRNILCSTGISFFSTFRDISRKFELLFVQCNLFIPVGLDRCLTSWVGGGDTAPPRAPGNSDHALAPPPPPPWPPA